MRFLRELFSLPRRVATLESSQEFYVATFHDALTDLDAEINALQAYVESDEATDASEVAVRTQRLKDLLAAAKAEPVSDPPAPGVPDQRS